MERKNESTLKLKNELLRIKVKHLKNELKLIKNEYEQRTKNYFEIYRDVEKEVINRTREAKELQERLSQAEKMEALGLLAGGVAHELNNLLSSIIGYPDLIMIRLERGLAPEKKYIDAIRQAGKLAKDIVDDLLAVTRRRVQEFVPINIKELILDYQKGSEFEHLMANSPSVKFSFELAEEELIINGSYSHIMKCLGNLVSNAAETTSRTTGEVNIRLEKCTLLRTADADISQTPILLNGKKIAWPPANFRFDVKPGEHALISVCDNGQGMSSTDLRRLFEPFYTTKKMGRSGTGLGLSVVWGTVKDHNGNIRIKSVLNQGTCFEFFLPLWYGDIDGDRPPKGQSPQKIKTFTGLSACFISSEKQNLDFLINAFKELGFTLKEQIITTEIEKYTQYESTDLLIICLKKNKTLNATILHNILQKNTNQRFLIISNKKPTKKEINQILEVSTAAYLQLPASLSDISNKISLLFC